MKTKWTKFISLTHLSTTSVHSSLAIRRLRGSMWYTTSVVGTTTVNDQWFLRKHEWSIYQSKVWPWQIYCTNFNNSVKKQKLLITSNYLSWPKHILLIEIEKCLHIIKRHKKELAFLSIHKTCGKRTWPFPSIATSKGTNHTRINKSYHIRHFILFQVLLQHAA